MSDGAHNPLESALNPLDKATSRLPWLGRQDLPSRLFILASIITAIITLVVVNETRPTYDEIMITRKWCADTLIYHGTEYTMNTLDSRYDPERNVQESFEFHSDGSVVFPGISSRPIRARWTKNEAQLFITDADTLGQIFNGVYFYTLTPEYFKMESASTLLSGSHLGVK